MSDALGDGRMFRALTVVDSLTCESPAIAVATSQLGERAVRVLHRFAATRGLPRGIVCDEATEFRSRGQGGVWQLLRQSAHTLS